jgi:hypothetical protein
MTTEGPVRVLCIAATGQSGSTLLARMLGEVPGYRAVGEVGRIWDKGVEEDMACSCGQPFHSCAFWGEVGERAFGGWHTVDGIGTARLRDQLQTSGTRLRHPMALPFLQRPRLWPAYREKVRTYAALMLPVYRAMHEITDGAVLVDSMKLPAHVYLMSFQMPELEVRVAHHIRDSRGYAYSNTKWVEKQGGEHRGSFRGRRPPWKSAVKWMWVNEAFDHLQRIGVPTAIVRYEDLVHDPVPQIERAAAIFGDARTTEDLGFINEDGIDLSAGHIASGSRWRMSSGRIALYEDLDWAAKLSQRDRQTVTTITYPLLRRYGYRLAGPLHETPR